MINFLRHSLLSLVFAASSVAFAEKAPSDELIDAVLYLNSVVHPPRPTHVGRRMMALGGPLTLAGILLYAKPMSLGQAFGRRLSTPRGLNALATVTAVSFIAFVASFEVVQLEVFRNEDIEAARTDRDRQLAELFAASPERQLELARAYPELAEFYVDVARSIKTHAPEGFRAMLDTPTRLKALN